MYIRPARIEKDLPTIVGIINPYESQPVTVEQIRAQFLNKAPGRIALGLVAVDENDAVTGYSYIVHVAEMPARNFYIWLSVLPAFRCQGIGSALWDASLKYLQEQCATRLASEVLDYDPDSLAFAEQRGFSIERQHFYSFLDLDTFDEAPYLPGIAALEAQGIRFCSLADFPDTPEMQRKFYELNLAVVKDIPGENWDFDSYPQFFERRILGAPWFRREGQLLAVDSSATPGEAWAGFASVRLTPETQSAYNATTGVIRPYRGRKIALALKVLAARYARQHGAQRVRTDNDSLNTPILAVNRKLGYQPQPGTYHLVSWLGETNQ